MPELFTAAPTTPTLNTTSPGTDEGIMAPPSPAIKEAHIHGLASFCQHPGSVSFQTQETDETILLLLRAHFITNIPWIITTLFLLVLPYLLGILFQIVHISFSFLSPQFSLLLTLFYYLMIFAYAFISFITWFYNTFLVTTKRIVDIDFSEVIYHNMAITKLELIDDIDYSQTGFIRSFFNYGDVFIQTAGNKANFEALGIPQPGRVIKIIGDLIGGPHA